MTDSVNTRAVVLNILLDVMEKDKLSHLVIREALDKYKSLQKTERAFITRLSEGTIERTIELDYLIDTYSKVKVNKMKPVIRNILRMSFYQIKYMDGVPESAVCNEAVKLTSKRGMVNLKGFVNGVIRSFIREPGKVKYPQLTSDKVKYYSVKYSVPEWIISLWLDEYGQDNTDKMLDSLDNPRRTCVRRNETNTSENSLIESFKSDGITFDKAPVTENAFYISDYERIDKLSAFKKGYIQVQDLSSMMVGLAADPKKDSICIDVCAAPGGKTIHIADILSNSGKVLSRDITGDKVKMINDNISRTGFKNVTTQVMDATKLDESMLGKADLVIADLPCSGLGVMSRKSDIKYKTNMNQIYELADIQKDILSVVSQYVKPGGVLIYSTCTVNMIENDGIVKWITDNLPFRLDSLKGLIPDELIKDNEEGFVQILPGEFGMDGFFVSRFIKE